VLRFWTSLGGLIVDTHPVGVATSATFDLAHVDLIISYVLSLFMHCNRGVADKDFFSFLGQISDSPPKTVWSVPSRP
jgi:hypothetical protein